MDKVYNTESMEQILADNVAMIDGQVTAMQTTKTMYEGLASALESEAASLDTQAAAQENIAATAMKTEYYTGSDDRRRSRRVPDTARRAAAAAAATRLRAQSAAKREQAAALRAQAAKISAQISNLQAVKTETTTYMRNLIDLVQRTDLSYAQMMEQVEEETQAFTARMQALYDSFNDNFPLYSEDVGAIAGENFNPQMGGVEESNFNPGVVEAITWELINNGTLSDEEKMNKLREYYNIDIEEESLNSKLEAAIIIGNKNITVEERVNTLREHLNIDESITDKELQYLLSYSIGGNSIGLSSIGEFENNLEDAANMLTPMESIFDNMTERLSSNPNKNLTAQTMFKLGMFDDLSDIQRAAWNETLGVSERYLVTRDIVSTSTSGSQISARLLAYDNLLTENMEKIYKLPSQHPCPDYSINVDIGGYEGHKGADFFCPSNTPIFASTSGKVIATRSGRPSGTMNSEYTLDECAGNYVRIRDADENDHWYAHNTSTEVLQGSLIVAGELIAYSGNSGYTSGDISAGYHLHYEVQSDGGFYYDSNFFEDISIFIP